MKGALGGAAPALLAAVLFGASTPLAKALVGEMPPLLLAGLLYLGSGLGLALLIALRRWRRGNAQGEGIARADWPWLAGAIVAGGALGPVLLMLGLQRSSAASAALLLNLEAVLTALLAWIVFRENAGARVVIGMLVIVAGGALLAWDPAGARLDHGALFVAAACLCWAIDNNLTRRVAANDAMRIAAWKGGIAGACNTALAWAGGPAWPGALPVGAALLVGFLGYGLSLVLFVVALRQLGTARTGAHFATAPLVGVALALAIWPSSPSASFWIAASLMAVGVWLHLSERHEHEHTHERLDHSHPHRHDEHHRHAHDFAWDGIEPHVHPHRHAPITHRHGHVPDLHHRHGHGGGAAASEGPHAA
jgi:drug/metabolite transporter (DMT)-like permease